MRLVGAGSKLLARAAPADELGGCCGQLGRVAARVTSLHHSLLALEPHSMVLGSFSLSLLMQVHEAAAVVESGGDAGAEWRPAEGTLCRMRRHARYSGAGLSQTNPKITRDPGLLLVLVHLLFVNVDSRPIRVRRAS